MANSSLALCVLLLSTASACGESTVPPAVIGATQSTARLRTIPVTSANPDAAAAFETGRDFADNVRVPEAIDQFQKAIRMDPDFALAHAYLGSALTGAEGLAELDRAVALSAKLPVAERDLIGAMATRRRGDEA